MILPIQKKNIHERLVNTSVDYRYEHEKLIDLAKVGDVEKLEPTLDEIKNYKKVMDSFSLEFLLDEG